MIFRTNARKRVANKANSLLRFLYHFQIKQVKKKELSSDEMFAVLDYEQKLRELTKDLFKKLER